MAKKPAKKPAGGLSFLPSPNISDPTIAADEQSAAQQVSAHPGFAGAAAHASLKTNKPGKKPAGGESVFASALDALDSIGGKAVSAAFLPSANRGFRLAALSPIAAVADQLGVGEDVAKATSAAVSPVIPFALPAAVKAAGGVGNVAKGAAFAVSPVGSVGAIPAAKAASKGLGVAGMELSKVPIPVEAGAMLSGGLFGAALGYGATKLIEENPDTPLANALISRKTGKSLTVGDQQEFFKDLAARPNRFIDVSSKNKSIPANASPGTQAAMQAALDGVPSAVVQSVAEQNKDFFVSPALNLSLKSRAKKNGWDVSGWERLTPGEKINNAFNQYSYWGTTLRNVLSAVGATASVPAAAKAIADAIASAPKDDGAALTQIAEAMVQPYTNAKMVMERDGLTAGLTTAFRDNPVDFVLAASTATRTLGRVGGIASRTGVLGKRAQAFAAVDRPVVAFRPGATITEMTPIPQEAGKFVFTPGQGTTPIEQFRAYQARNMQNARLVSEARAAQAEAEAAGLTPDQIDIISRQRAEAGLPTLSAGDVVVGRKVQAGQVVGYTGPNILSPIRLELDKFIAENSKRYADFLEKRAAATYTRREANVVQGIGVEIERALTDALGRAPTQLERNRAAFELTWAKTDLKGVPVTPARIADWFDARVREIEAKPGVRKPRDNAQIALWRDSEKFWRDLDGVKLTDEVVANLRTAAAPLKEKADRLIAAALGETVSEAKRGNYIRLLVIDPSFKVAARELKSSVNTAATRMVRAQRSAASIAKRVSEYALQGDMKRERFLREHKKLVSQLRTIEKQALIAGQKDIADAARSQREALVLARASSPDRVAGVADQIRDAQSLTLPAEMVPAEARAAYEAAQAASEAIPAAEARAAEAMAGALTTRGKAMANVPGEREVSLARQAVDKAREDLQTQQSFPKPDADAVTKAEAALAKAEQRVANLESARSSAAEVATLRTTRDVGVKAAVSILKKQTPVLDTNWVSVAINTAEDVAAIEIKQAKSYYYTLERAQNEVLDEFIARSEANDQGAMLHLVQKGDILKMDRIELIAPKKLNFGPTGRIRGGRLKESRGYLFSIGGEDMAKSWKNLMFDTSEIIAAETWQKKMQQLIELTGVRVTVGENAQREALAAAEARAAKGESMSVAMQEEVERVLNREHWFNIGEFKILNTGSPKALTPAERVFMGGLREGEIDDSTLAGMMWKEVNDRTIDPNAPSDYFIIPRAVYDGIQKSLQAEAFSFKQTGRFISAYRLDQITRAWRTLTLNILPKTAFANMTGSATLAMIGGAGPRAMWYAWKAIRSGGKKMPLPRELQQRWFDPLTASVEGRNKGTAIAGYWINGMRQFNSLSEDFGRLAVWYSKAYPAAMKEAGQGSIFYRARSLNNAAKDLIERMANDDPEWVAANERWMQQSFDFLGDLHRGGRFASTLRIAIPFWQWYAHMLKLTFFTMPLKYPGRALMLQRLGDLGDEYQRTHGIIFPFGEDLIPLWDEQIAVNGQPQWVSHALTTYNWYPFATISGIGSREGTSAPISYIQSSVNPLASNGTLLVLSLMSIVTGRGNALEWDGSRVARAAKDQYGNDITSVSSEEFLNYVANHLGMMVPLSPMFLSQAARPDNTVLWGQKEEYKKGPHIPPHRVDAATLFQNFSPGNAIEFAAKAALGVQLSETPGIGPVERYRLIKMLRGNIRDMQTKQRNITRALNQIHKID